jgi:D-alanine-D-alanine ligase
VKQESTDEASNGDSDADKFSGNNVAEDTGLQQTKADKYAEWDSEETILAVKTALEQNHKVTLIEANEEAYLKLLCAQPDIVFNIAEGVQGPSREAQIPAILEMLNIPYTGSDPITLGICLDKSRAKEILTYYGVANPEFTVLDSTDQLSYLHLPLPCIVKPLHEGSSKGIFNSSVVYTVEQLRRQVGRVFFEYQEPALVERFLEGREFTVAVLGNSSNIRVLPIIEIRFDSLPDGVNPIYSYEAKWIWDTIESPIDVHECPAGISQKLKKQIEDLCVQSYLLLRCRDWCRIDIRLDEKGHPNILELNPLPGILPKPEQHSCFPQASRAAGMDYNQMINTVLEVALKRYALM